MPLTDAQIAYRLSLPAHPEQHRMGAVPLPDDPRDFPAFLHPGIWANVAAGNLAPTNLLSFIQEPRYDQAAEGSCAPASTAGNCTLAHSMADGSWPQYNFRQLYAEAGGVGNSGSDGRRVLQICIEQGIPTSSGGREFVVKSYVFVDNSPVMFRQQVKAALAAGLSVLIACLIPIPFGWNTGMALSSGYHQWEAVGWMVDSQGVEYWLVLNSWGDAWPGDAPSGTPPGVGRIRCDAVEQAGQNGYRYAIVPTDLTIKPPPPPPPPPPPDPSGYAAEVIRLTNVARTAAGLQPVAAHPALTQAAQDFALFLGQHNAFDHNANGTPLSRMLAAGIDPNGYTVWGENIAAGEAGPSATMPKGGWHCSATGTGSPPDSEAFMPGGAFTDWMNSPGHRANILSAPYTHIGVGYASVPGSQYGTYWVMDLIGLKGAPPPPVLFTVTGYAPAAPSGGDNFTIQGTGFQTGATAIWNGVALPVTLIAANQLRATAPLVAQPITAPVIVSQGGVSVTGPPLLVSPRPLPPPPPPPVVAATVTAKATGIGVAGLAKDQTYTLNTGVVLTLKAVVFDSQPDPGPDPGPTPNPSLKVTHQLQRFGGKLYLWAWLVDAAGLPIGASVRLFLNGLDQSMARQVSRSGTPAVWQALNAPVGTPVRLEFRTDDNRQTTDSFVVDR